MAAPILRDALLDAIGVDDLPAMSALLDAGRDPRAPTGKGKTRPLRWAAQHNARRCLEELLRRGCPVDEGDDYGTPLATALAHWSEAAALLLLSRGADPNLPSGRDGSPPLLGVRKPSLLKALLEKGAKTDFRFHARFVGPGATPLLDAVAEGDDAVIDLLLAYGADVNAVGEWAGSSALALLATEAKLFLRNLPQTEDEAHAADLRKRISEKRACAERLAAAGAGAAGDDAALLKWFRSLDLEQLERDRLNFLSLGGKEAAARPDFGARVEALLGAADAVSDLSRLSSIVGSILAKKAVKSAPDYARLFAVCCDRQRPIEDHVRSLFGDVAWSAEADESGMVESFADGSYDTLNALLACLDDKAFAATPVWRICLDAFIAAVRRIDRVPDGVAKLRRNAFLELRPDAAEVKALLKDLGD